MKYIYKLKAECEHNGEPFAYKGTYKTETNAIKRIKLLEKHGFNVKFYEIIKEEE